MVTDVGSGVPQVPTPVSGTLGRGPVHSWTDLGGGRAGARTESQFKRKGTGQSKGTLSQLKTGETIFK